MERILLTSPSHDTEARLSVYSRLTTSLLQEAFPNDPDLLAEIQCFWNNPTFLESIVGNWRISTLAMKVIGWLKVCPKVLWSICQPQRLDNFSQLPHHFFQRCDCPFEETVSLWKSHVLEEDLW